MSATDQPAASDIADTVSGPFLAGLLDQAARLGLGRERILGAVALSSEALEDPDVRIPRRTMYRFWEEIERHTCDAAVGLHMAEQARPGDFAVLDYAVRNSATLGDAYARISRYSHILHNGVDVVLETEGSGARLFYVQAGGSPRQVAEWVVATWLVVGRDLVEFDWNPRAVEFQHSGPADTSELERLSRAPVTFDATSNGILFDRALLDQPVEKADCRLGAVVGHFAEQVLAQLPRSQRTVDEVRRLLVSALSGGDPRLEAIAERMHMSPRSLRRRLKNEGVASYRELLDEMRRELALKNLGQSRMAISEVAFLLGFSEPSAFHRAFKRWSGLTPGEFRTAHSA